MHAKRWIVVVAMTAAATDLFAADPSPTGAAFHLFAGSDITVQVNGEYRPIVSADNGTFSIRTAQKVEAIPLRKITDVQVKPRIKLTNLAAQIQGVSAVLSSDAARQAQFKAMSDAEGSAGAASVDRDRGYAEFTRAGEVAENQSLHTYAPQDGKETKEQFVQRLTTNTLKEGNRQLQAGLASGTSQMNQSSLQLNAALRAAPNSGEEVTITPQLSGNGTVSADVQTTNHVSSPPAVGAARIAVPKHLVDEGDGNSDRIDVTCEVSAPQPLENAYAVLVTDFTLPRRGSNSFRRVVGKKIGSLDAKPRKITIEAANFPPGFVVTKYDVLIYGNGQQVATNLLENAAALTEEDAYQYILSQYLESNKGKTRPPAAMLMSPKSALSFAATDATLQQPIYVTVDAKGVVTSVTADAAGTKEAPAPAKSALTHLRFLPALDNGTQTGGHAKLIVADFVK